MAKVSKNELGKGIRALLGNTDEVQEPEVKAGVDLISVHEIEVNPFQPRKEFDQEELNQLAESIKSFGLIQPITLRKLGSKQYQLISGERRLRASKLAGLDTIPAYVRDANDQEMLEMALVENIQRHDLNAVEIAVSYQRLIDECGLTHEQMSTRVGKKRSTITNYLRLLKLPPVIQGALVTDKISMGHARALLTLPTEMEQLATLKTVLENGLSVRATEAICRNLSEDKVIGTSTDHKKTPKNPYERDLIDHLSKYLGARVQLKRNRAGKGALTIPFASDDDLNRILDLIEGN